MKIRNNMLNFLGSLSYELIIVMIFLALIIYFYISIYELLCYCFFFNVSYVLVVIMEGD